MARRESQGLQIALILFVMLTVVLSVTTYLYWSKSEDRGKEADQLSAEKKAAEQAMRDALDDSAKLKQMIGHPPEAKVDDIETDFQRDMLAYAQMLPETNRNYRAIPKELLDTISDLGKQVAEAREQVQQHIAQKEQIRKEETGKTVVAVAGQEADRVDLLAVRSKIQTDMQRVAVEKKELAQQLDLKRKAMTEQETRSRGEIETLAQQVDRLSQTLVQKNKIVNDMTNEKFEVPDGKITWVNQASRNVFVDLGHADGLRTQVTFSVYGKDQNDLVNAEKKGSIEITKIRNEHLAEARILSDSLADPFLPGDVVYSPLWSAGSRLRFALAGFMDTNDDGSDDRPKIRNLITMNGGVIDAEDAKDGSKHGRMSIHTRYLVLGDRPTEKTDDKARRVFTQMIDEATRLGVEQMSVHKLVSTMGFAGAERTVPLGRNVRSEDFKRRYEGTTPKSTGSTSEVFRKRAAPTRGARGAY